MIEIVHKLAAVQRLDNPKVGQIELSVSHHGSLGAGAAGGGRDTMKPPMMTGHFKKRLLSAGVRNRVIVGASSQQREHHGSSLSVNRPSNSGRVKPKKGKAQSRVASGKSMGNTMARRTELEVNRAENEADLNNKRTTG